MDYVSKLLPKMIKMIEESFEKKKMYDATLHFKQYVICGSATLSFIARSFKVKSDLYKSSWF